MKNLKKLGKVLGKQEQKSISGGKRHCNYQSDCSSDECCVNSVCYPFGTPGYKCTLDPNPFTPWW